MTLAVATADVAPCPVPLIARADSTHVDRAVRSGELARVIRGVYAPAPRWRALAPWERYLARVHATARRYPKAVFVRESAAALRGLPVFGEPPHVHAVALASATTRLTAEARLHAAERMPRFERIGGLRVATAAEIASDIARLRHPAIGLAVADAALRRDRTLDVAEIRTLTETHPSSRGRRRARWVLDRATPLPESALESVSLAVVEWLGFPAPELQVWIRGERAGEDNRADFVWNPWRIGGEADGDIKYSGELGDARAALRSRSVRDARLMRNGLASVAHWGWNDVVTHAPLRAILLSAGLPLLRPPEPAPLNSLARAVRGDA